MPYTKNEIENLDFYTDFRDGLRYKYLNQILEMKIISYIHMKIYLPHLVVKQ